MRDPNEYSIASRRTMVDGEMLFEARVLELPDVVGYGATREEAETEALEAIGGLQKLAAELDQPFPEPASIPSDFSGRVTLRMTRSLHQKAAMFAEHERASLNSFVCEAVRVRVSMREFDASPIAQLTARYLDLCSAAAGSLLAGAGNLTFGAQREWEVQSGVVYLTSGTVPGVVNVAGALTDARTNSANVHPAIPSVYPLISENQPRFHFKQD